jgi:hypothetical protein
MRHFSHGIVLRIVLCLFTCRTFSTGAYDGPEGIELPIQAGNTRVPHITHSLVPCHPAANLT